MVAAEGCVVGIVGVVEIVPAAEVVPVVVAGAVVCDPPPTEPLAASCCWIYCLSSGEMLLAVQPSLEPPPAPNDSTLIDTPQTLAATSIGTWAVTGMLSRLTLSDTDRLLSTF